MKKNLFSCLLIAINMYIVLARDRVIWPKFKNDNSNLFKLENSEQEDNLDKLIFKIFHESNDRDQVIWPKFNNHNSKQEDNLEKSKDPQDLLNAETNFTDGLQIFADNLYKTASKNKVDNVLLSPLSINVALGMIASGAEGNTKTEILKTLHFRENEQLVKISYKNLIDNLMNVTGLTLQILNKVFINDKLQVKSEFKDVLLNNFHAEEEQLNFIDSETAAKSINTWVSRGTNDKIKNIVKPDDLSEDTAMIITNVVYFKGEWKNKFSKVDRQIFYTNSNKETLVPIMYQYADLEFGYASDINATFIELPYKNENLKMLIVLPNLIDGLEQVEKSLETMNLKTLRQKRYLSKVDLYLPKFRVENTIDLNEVLQEMGMKEMFSPFANFSGISEGNLQVSKIKQKTFIEVNENGAEAAAVSEIEIGWKIGGEDNPKLFVVDHPFHYKIIRTIGENDGIVLFAGNCKYIE
ncbi:antichymotrypsin-2-like [Leptopilina boulardi]|uniref:antichymotrypsin-2-like n=1 Tax=Leptopilina boulardi TaxID=63433 RepID=UPI0021F55287|nr:antichymotrypsin-2-like [Leptopilina boulardi]